MCRALELAGEPKHVTSDIAGPLPLAHVCVADSCGKSSSLQKLEDLSTAPSRPMTGVHHGVENAIAQAGGAQPGQILASCDSQMAATAAMSAPAASSSSAVQLDLGKLVDKAAARSQQRDIKKQQQASKRSAAAKAPQSAPKLISDQTVAANDWQQLQMQKVSAGDALILQRRDQL